MVEDTMSSTAGISTSNDDTGNASIVTESSPSGHGSDDVMLIFFGFVIVNGIVGSLANGLVLKILLAPKLRGQVSNLLMINQIATDLYSCVLLVVCYTYRLLRIPPIGYTGLVVCSLVENDLLIFVGLTGSIASVGTITAERYFKVVHSIAHRKNFRDWMVYVAIALTWINGILLNIFGLWTAQVADDACTSNYDWPTDYAATLYGVFLLAWEYFVPMMMFVYCYGHILLVVRAQMKVFHGGGGNQDAAESAAAGQQASANKAQMSVIATMIGICVAFAVCWTPNQIWYLLLVVGYPVTMDTYYLTLFMIFLNTALNPFIYAFKHDGVRKGLRRMLGRKEEPKNLQSGITSTTTA